MHCTSNIALIALLLLPNPIPYCLGLVSCTSRRRIWFTLSYESAYLYCVGISESKSQSRHNPWWRRKSLASQSTIFDCKLNYKYEKDLTVKVHLWSGFMSKNTINDVPNARSSSWLQEDAKAAQSNRNSPSFDGFLQIGKVLHGDSLGLCLWNGMARSAFIFIICSSKSAVNRSDERQFTSLKYLGFCEVVQKTLARWWDSNAQKCTSNGTLVFPNWTLMVLYCPKVHPCHGPIVAKLAQIVQMPHNDIFHP